MSLEIKWTDTDPLTGQKRFLAAERFAGVWRFRFKLQRRGEWTQGLQPTRDMWEHVLESMRRRCQRDQDVGPEDVEQLERLLAEFREPPSLE